MKSSTSKTGLRVLSREMEAKDRPVFSMSTQFTNGLYTIIVLRKANFFSF